MTSRDHSLDYIPELQELVGLVGEFRGCMFRMNREPSAFYLPSDFPLGKLERDVIPVANEFCSFIGTVLGIPVYRMNP